MVRQPQIVIKTPRDIPAIDQLLTWHATQQLVARYGHDSVIACVREVVGEIRHQLLTQDRTNIALDEVFTRVEHHLVAQETLSLRAVINAAGVVIHTNLGRAPLSQEAIQAMSDIAGGYSNLEFDLESGKRGKRTVHIEQLVSTITGAEAAVVVNNAAAALVLTLSALAQGREAIISRGQLIEIGGGFRIPEVMTQSGVKLVEVGTTNRTRAQDYENAITEHTAALMRAHSSNFQIIGFTEETPLNAMAALAHRHGIICVDDLGSGALLDTAAYGLAHEPTVQESLDAGADVIIFSGDKLLGGPQAGLIVGKANAVNPLKRHPLARALRVDKLTTMALAVTLQHYQFGQATEKVPVWQMISKPLSEIERICQHWAGIVPGEILESESTVGGGSLPGQTMPTRVFAPAVNSAQAAQQWLRERPTPVISRVKSDRLLLDPRTVLPHQFNEMERALHELAHWQSL